MKQQLAAVDEANLVLDHAGQVNVFLVAGLLAPGGFVDGEATCDLAELRENLRGRIAAQPELRRRVAAVGRRHRWIESAPDLEHHIRLAEPVEGLEGLERKCAELMSQPLERDRPLWEILVVPGASETGPGVVLRIHHSVADGVEAVAIVQRLFEPGEPGGAAGERGACDQAIGGGEPNPAANRASPLYRCAPDRDDAVGSWGRCHGVAR